MQCLAKPAKSTKRAHSLYYVGRSSLVMSRYIANREHQGVEGNWHQYHHRDNRYQPRYRSSGGSSYGSHSRFIKRTMTRPSNPLRYKTELCRTFEESGFCRFAESCTFAHGIVERRAVPRHPRYKTELCRTYHSTGFCQYGARCHFIHSPEEQSRGFPLNNLRHHSHLDLLPRDCLQFPKQAGSVQSLENFNCFTYDFKALQVGAKPTYLGNQAMQASDLNKYVLSLGQSPNRDMGIDSVEESEYLSGDRSTSSRSASPIVESLWNSSVRLLPSPPISPTLKACPNWGNSEEDISDIQGNCIRSQSEDLEPFTFCWITHRECQKEPTCAGTCLPLPSLEEPKCCFESALGESLLNEVLATHEPSITNPMEVSKGLNMPSIIALNRGF